MLFEIKTNMGDFLLPPDQLIFVRQAWLVMLKAPVLCGAEYEVYGAHMTDEWWCRFKRALDALGRKEGRHFIIHWQEIEDFIHATPLEPPTDEQDETTGGEG